MKKRTKLLLILLFLFFAMLNSIDFSNQKEIPDIYIKNNRVIATRKFMQKSILERETIIKNKL